MYPTSSHFSILNFRHPVTAWLLLTVFSLSFVPSVSFAQQPTATISALSGDVLVPGQTATVGTALQAGDTVQTQAGASAVLALSDGSEIQLGENTQINIDDLSQTGTGARASSIKLLAGWLRALLSPGHQQEGSSFTIETPNAQLGVKFSQPDIEVSYDPATQETIGIAHTVALMAKNLLTDEAMLVPVGSSVIIVGTTIKIVAGILAIAGATEAATTGTGTTGAGTSSTGTSGMGTGTKVAIGAGAAAAAGGVVALASGADGGDDESENVEDSSRLWFFTGNCVAQGCTDAVPCLPDVVPACCGTCICETCTPNWYGRVTRSDTTLSGVHLSIPRGESPLSGSISGNSVSFIITQDTMMPVPGNTTNYTGTLNGNTIRGDFAGSGYQPLTTGGDVLVTWTGTFTVNIEPLP